MIPEESSRSTYRASQPCPPPRPRRRYSIQHRLPEADPSAHPAGSAELAGNATADSKQPTADTADPRGWRRGLSSVHTYTLRNLATSALLHPMFPRLAPVPNLLLLDRRERRKNVNPPKSTRRHPLRSGVANWPSSLLRSVFRPSLCAPCRTRVHSPPRPLIPRPQRGSVFLWPAEALRRVLSFLRGNKPWI